MIGVIRRFAAVPLALIVLILLLAACGEGANQVDPGGEPTPGEDERVIDQPLGDLSDSVLSLDPESPANAAPNAPEGGAGSNDGPERAIEITLQEQIGPVSPGHDEQVAAGLQAIGSAPFHVGGPSTRWFKIRAKQGWTYDITALDNFRGRTTVYDASGETVLAVSIYVGQIATFWVAPADGIFLIKVEATSGAHGMVSVIGYPDEFLQPDFVPALDPSEYSAPSNPLSFSYEILLGEDDRPGVPAKFLTQPGAAYVFEKPEEIEYLEVCSLTPFEKTSPFHGEVCRDIKWQDALLAMVLPSPYTSIRVIPWSLPFSGAISVRGIPNDHGAGPGDATSMNAGEPVDGELSRNVRNPTDERDYFSFHAEAGTENFVTVSFDTPDFYIGKFVVFPPGSIYSMYGSFQRGNTMSFRAYVTGDYILLLGGPSVREEGAPRNDEPYSVTITSEPMALPP